MLARFLQAAIPEPVVCLGIRLRPFSLGSQLILARLDSPYAVGGRLTLDELMLAVLICSQTYRENLAFISGGDASAKKALRAWSRRLLGPWWNRRNFNFIAASNLFDNYRKRAVEKEAMPITQSEANNLKPTESPWELSAIIHCMRLGQSLDDILDQPIALTRWLVAGYGESKGVLEIVSPIPERTPEQIAKDAAIVAKIMEAHGPC